MANNISREPSLTQVNRETKLYGKKRWLMVTSKDIFFASSELLFYFRGHVFLLFNYRNLQKLLYLIYSKNCYFKCIINYWLLLAITCIKFWTTKWTIFFCLLYIFKSTLRTFICFCLVNLGGFKLGGTTPSFPSTQSSTAAPTAGEWSVTYSKPW